MGSERGRGRRSSLLFALRSFCVSRRPRLNGGWLGACTPRSHSTPAYRQQQQAASIHRIRPVSQPLLFSRTCCLLLASRTLASSSSLPLPFNSARSMPLPDSFPPPPPIKRRVVIAPQVSNVPTADVPSMRRLIPSSEPFLPNPPPTANSHLMPSLLGYEAKLFNCECSPKCIEFIKPRDHPELSWIGSALEPLRTRVVAAGPTPGRHVKSRYADFDVDARVAYEFNSVGFYSEVLQQLDHNYSALLQVNERSQAFLHQAREKIPDVDFTKPRVYKPYYPTSHLVGKSFVPPKPLKDARAVAAQVVAPGVAGLEASLRKLRDVEQIEAQLTEEAQAVAKKASEGSLLPAHLRGEHRDYGAPSSSSAAASTSFSSSSVPLSSARAKLASERAQFAQQMKDQLLGMRSISSSARSSSSNSE